MEFVKENQILLYEELCAKPVDENDPVVKATRLFRDNIRLANYAASKFSEPRDPSIDKDDILQCAYEGLWKACLSYDETSGNKFSTYATPTINGTILTTLRNAEALKTPRVYKDIRSALISHGFTLPLTAEEVDVLVSEGKFSRRQIMDYAEIDIYTFEHPIGKDDSMTLAEVISADSIGHNVLLSNEFEEDELENLVDSVLLYIKPSQRDMVEEWIYAIIDGEKVTQHQLSRKYNISQGYACRVMNAAIHILKMHKGEILDLCGLG